MLTTNWTRRTRRATRRLSVAALAAGLVALTAACLPSGVVDASFGGSSGVSLPCGVYGSVMATSTTGNTVVACSYAVPDTSPQVYGTRLVSSTSTGARDSSFGTDGVVEVPLGGSNVSLYGVTRSSDGGVLVAGLSPNYDYRIYRYTADGLLDSGFGPNGDGYVVLGSSLDGGVLSQSNGLTFVVTQELVSCSGCGTDEGLKVRLFDASGQLGGAIVVPLNGFVDPVPAGATEARVVLNPKVAGFDPNYGFLIGGDVYTRSTLNNSTVVTNLDLGVVRLVSPGVLDTAYGTGGLARVDVGYDESGQPTVGLGQTISVTAATLQGSSVLFGLVPSVSSDPAVVRIGHDGQLDGTFGGDGLVSAPTGGAWVTGIGADVVGRAVLATHDNRTGVPLVRRLTPGGSVDTTFGTAGLLTLPAPGVSARAIVSTPLAASYVLVDGTTAGVDDFRLLKVS
ncbi:MAG: hypothetical protein ACXWBN_05370 [Acidimicrobiales bacterium]